MALLIKKENTDLDLSKKLANIKADRDKLNALSGFAKTSAKSIMDINGFAEKKVRCEWEGGLILQELERGQGSRNDLTSSHHEKKLSPYQAALSEAGLGHNAAYRWQVMAWVASSDLDAYFEKQIKADKIITSEDVFRLGRKAMPHEVIEPVAVEGKYAVIVIDPPWPMQKIERDVRPNQAGFDYPTMSEDDLREFPVEDMAMDDCHLFHWTTHKFMPMAERLTAAWGFRYVCNFVWHKPGGFQPIGLPQYNCEFCLYARRGSPKFIDTKDFFTCFEAPRREHSRKPDFFYDTVRRVTDGPRIDVFSREKRDGFDQWGNQTEKFESSNELATV